MGGHFVTRPALPEEIRCDAMRSIPEDVRGEVDIWPPIGRLLSSLKTCFIWYRSAGLVLLVRSAPVVVGRSWVDDGLLVGVLHGCCRHLSSDYRVLYNTGLGITCEG